MLKLNLNKTLDTKSKFSWLSPATKALVCMLAAAVFGLSGCVLPPLAYQGRSSPEALCCSPYWHWHKNLCEPYCHCWGCMSYWNSGGGYGTPDRLTETDDPHIKELQKKYLNMIAPNLRKVRGKPLWIDKKKDPKEGCWMYEWHYPDAIFVIALRYNLRDRIIFYRVIDVKPPSASWRGGNRM